MLFHNILAFNFLIKYYNIIVDIVICIYIAVENYYFFAKIFNHQRSRESTLLSTTEYFVSNTKKESTRQALNNDGLPSLEALEK